MTDNTNASLNDAELNNVAGGSSSSNVDVVNANGQVVGYYNPSEVGIYFWPCPYCGKPMHVGKLYAKYCDPCDQFFYAGYSTKAYDGTGSQLKAESL